MDCFEIAMAIFKELEATGVVYGYISKYLANKVPKQSIYNYDGWHFEDAQ